MYILEIDGCFQNVFMPCVYSEPACWCYDYSPTSACGSIATEPCRKEKINTYCTDCSLHTGLYVGYTV